MVSLSRAWSGNSLHHDEQRQFDSLTLKLVSYNLHDLYLRANPPSGGS